MKNNIKCPFCQQELSETIWEYGECETTCSNCDITGNSKLWQELIRTKKQLVTKCNQLDVAVDALKYANKCIKGGCVNWETEIDKALEQITALEQKDVK